MKDYPKHVDIRSIDKIDKQLRKMCRQIEAYIRENYRHSYNKVAAICYDTRHISNAYADVSHAPGNTQFAPSLEAEMRRRGNIGQFVGHTMIGACAEQHAANAVIKNGQPDLTMLAYSSPIRPRTKLRVKPCSNCKNILGI